MEIAPINFCNKVAFNLRHEIYKKDILKELFDKYKIIVTENSCSIYDKKYARTIVNQFNKPTHIFSTNTKGNRYYLYFRRDEFDKNMCVFIDRKICRGYTQPRVIYTNFRMDNKVFDGTIVHGELVRTTNDNWYFMLNDMISYCGRKITHCNKMERIKYMYEFLNNHYTSDSILDVCVFKVKQYFTYKDMNTFLSHVKKLPYQVNGILFNSLVPSNNDILLLHNLKTAFEYTTSKSNKPEQSYKTNRTDDKPNKPNTIRIAKTDKPNTIRIAKPVNTAKPANEMNDELYTFILSKIEGGIFQLVSLVNNNEKIYGHARIDKMKTQRMVEKALIGKTTILMDCKYNTKFHKFVPIQPSNKKEADQYIKVVKYVKTR
jgi:hypothetical protein